MTCVKSGWIAGIWVHYHRFITHLKLFSRAISFPETHEDQVGGGGGAGGGDPAQYQEAYHMRQEDCRFYRG